MRYVSIFAASIIMLSAAGTASALDVGKSVEIDGDVAALWRRIGDWCAISRWHPDIASCEEVSRGLKPSRILTTKTGETIQDTFMRGSGTSYSYRMLRGPLPVTDFVAMLSLSTRTRGKVVVTWTTTFTEQQGVSPDTAKKAVAAFITAGIEGIKRVP